MKAQSLKNAILQLAVQGKLVPQNPQDEPASELLKRIKAEKTQLIKEKKIKAEKPLAPITDEEKPFNIPDSWEWVRLDEISCKIGSGSTPTGGKTAYVGEGINFIRSQNVYNEGLRLENIAYIPSSIHNKMSGSAVYPKDILLNITGGSIGRCAIVSDDFTIGNINQHVMIVRQVNDILRFWVHCVLISSYIQRLIMDVQVGVSREGLSALKIKSFLIPIPPLHEQQRIVEKIGQLMPLVEQYDSYEKELSALEAKFPEALKKSVLQFAVQGKLVPQNPQDEPASELLKKIQAEKAKLIKGKKIKAEKPLAEITDEEKPFDIPESWEWVRLGKIGSWGSGATPSRTNAAYYNGSIPWLKTGDLTDGYIYEIPESISELALEKTSLRLNPSDAVLIAMYGATIGKVGILTFPATTNQACCACSAFDGVYNKYLFYFLLSQRDNFKCLSEGGAQPNISKEKILKYAMPLPPLAEQHRIVEKVEQVLALCDVLADENKLKKYQPLKRLAKVIEFTPIQTEEEHEHLIAARADEISPETRTKEQERLALLRKKR